MNAFRCVSRAVSRAVKRWEVTYPAVSLSELDVFCSLAGLDWLGSRRVLLGGCLLAGAERLLAFGGIKWF